MKSSRYSLMFRKLITSYAITISILTSVIGLTSYIFFTKTYNAELLRLNSITHSQLKDKIIREIAIDIINIYADMVSPNKNIDMHLLFKNKLSGNHSKILNVHYMLRNTVVVKTDHIKAISVYFRDNNFILSSSSGINIIDNSIRKKTIEYCDKILAAESKGYTFSFTPFDTYCDSSMSFVGIYPMGNTYEKAQGFIAIDINPDLLDKIITQYSTSTTKYYLVDQKGNFIFNNSDMALISSPLPDKVYKSQSPALESLVMDYDHEKVMFMYSYIPELKCTLIGVTSVDSFYQETIYIRNTLFVICLCSILLGLFFSGYFSRVIYEPLNNVLVHFKKHSHFSNIDSKNEYVYIDHVFNTLSVKVSELESLFERNKQLIMSGFIFELLNKSLKDIDIFKEKVDFLDIDFPGDNFCVVQFVLDDIKQRIEKIKECEYIVYSIIDEINNMQNSTIKMYAVKTSDYIVSAICNISEDYKLSLKSYINKLINLFEKKYYIQVFVCISNFTYDPLLTGGCYNEVKLLYPYIFLMPHKKILTIDDVPAIISDMDFPSELIVNFTIALKQCSMEKLKIAVQEIISKCKTGIYSYENCNRHLLYIVYELIDYIKTINLTVEEKEIEKLHSEFKLNENIDALGKWIIEVAHNYVYQKQEKYLPGIKVADLIKSIALYIDENISEDISLFTVAERFEISSAYLSRIFKAETGMSYIEYVTKKRLEKAAHLLKYTDLSVNSIASRVGFNSSAYFIKKFRMEYNVTPMSFKRSKHIISTAETNGSS